ncbi:MAG: PorP/SprF family type IX secretion system membrane protein [Vicingaceae bacterium]
MEALKGKSWNWQLLIAIIFIGSFAAKAQDPQFSQFYANRFYLNPAFAGTERCPRVGLNYRNQWPSLDQGFITYSASYDQHVGALSGGLGLLALRDEAGAGAVTRQEISVMYAYQLNITRFFSMTAGAQVGYIDKRLDWSSLTFGDMIDPRQGFIYQTSELPINDPAGALDFSVGVLGFSEKFFGGFAVHHITQPNVALTTVSDPSSGGGDFNVESRIPRKYTVHAGAVIPIRGLGGVDKGSISPNFIFQNQAKFTQFNYGFYATRSVIIGGLWVRHSLTNFDAITAMFGVHMDRYKIGYSYDLTVSTLGQDPGGSHEISFVLNLNCKVKKVSYRTVSCPTF